MTPAPPDDRTPPSPERWVARRVRLLGGAAVVGAVAGAAGVVSLAFLWSDPREATETTFALGALFFGFGTLGWSGSVMAGRSVEEMQAHLDVATDWTEADSRRAMTRIAGLGAGAMVGSSLASAVVL